MTVRELRDWLTRFDDDAEIRVEIETFEGVVHAGPLADELHAFRSGDALDPYTGGTFQVLTLRGAEIAHA